MNNEPLKDLLTELDFIQQNMIEMQKALNTTLEQSIYLRESVNNIINPKPEDKFPFQYDEINERVNRGKKGYDRERLS